MIWNTPASMSSSPIQCTLSSEPLLLKEEVLKLTNSLDNASWLPRVWEAIDCSWGWAVSDRSIHGVIFFSHVFIYIRLYVVD